MARFARSGRNWEGRAWIVNPAVASLLDVVEAAWVEPHATDGTVASQSHDAVNPGSDHRPYPYSGSGVVYAADVGETAEDQGSELAEQLRASRDPRIRYVIHENRLFSSYSTPSRRPWEWGPYTSPNPHSDHVHVSVWRTAGPGEWAISLGSMLTPDEEEFVRWLKRQVEESTNPAFDASVAKARERGVFSQFTQDEDVVTAAKLAAFLDRGKLLDAPTGTKPHTHPLQGTTGLGG